MMVSYWDFKALRKEYGIQGWVIIHTGVTEFRENFTIVHC